MACGVLVCIAFRGTPLPPLSEQTKEAKPSFDIDTRGNTCPCDTIEREVKPLYTDDTGRSVCEAHITVQNPSDFSFDFSPL